MSARKVLENYYFKITSHRVDVLNYFIRSNRALTHHDLELVLKGKIDRVSIYRTLNLFTETKIICRLVDSNGKVSYVFDGHFDRDSDYNYSHFKCKFCNDVVKLPRLPKSYLDQLDGLKIDRLNILAEGVCHKCEKNEELTDQS